MKFASHIAAAFALFAGSPVLSQNTQTLSEMESAPKAEAPQPSYARAFLEAYPDMAALNVQFRSDEKDPVIILVSRGISGERAGRSFGMVTLSPQFVSVYSAWALPDGNQSYDITDPTGLRDDIRKALRLDDPQGWDNLQDTLKRITAEETPTRKFQP